MAEDNWDKVRKIFDEASARNGSERRDFVVSACGGDESLRAEVESLLDSLDDAEDFMETPAVAHVAESIEPETRQLERGHRLRHYEIIELIGAGGMGEVYLAKDKRLDRKVAIKVLNEKFARDRSSLNRFVAEAKAASALNHPNILVIHEIGTGADGYYIVSEFVRGRTLRDVLKKSAPKLDEVLDYSIQIAGALTAAHQARIVHRDVKPENIMVRPDGFAKVLDFGLAKLVTRQNKSILGLEDSTAVGGNQTAKGVILGTIKYMSPEQAKGERVDERTDIFSLGVVFYEMITGRTPFEGESVSETSANLITLEPPPLAGYAPNIPPELARIVAKLLQKNTDDRYQAMRDVFNDLKELRENLAAEAKMQRYASNATALLGATTGRGLRNSTAGTTLGAISESIQRHKPLTAFLSVGLLVVSVILSYSLFPTKSSATPTDKRSIAVMPVRAIAAAARDELYELGIAESVIHRLGLLKGLTVRPLKAVRKYSEGEQDPVAVGREQQVDYVLASIYQIANGRIRVTGQLINVASGQIEVPYKSEKVIGDVFAVQDEIAAEVRNLLQTQLSIQGEGPAADRRGTANEAAYRLYLQGMNLVEKETAADAKRAMEVFDEAVRLDPNYAKAWAAKARAHCLYAHVGGDTPAAQFAFAEPALDRAFELDADLADAHAVRAIIVGDYDWNPEEGDRLFRRAIELSPNNDIFYRWYANRLACQGRGDEAIAMVRTAIDINPNYVNHQLQYGRILYAARRFDEAIAQMEHVEKLDPSFPLTYSIMYRSYHARGDGSRAYEAFMKMIRARGTDAAILGKYEATHARGGWHGVLGEFLEFLKSRNVNGSAAYSTAVISAMTGQHEQAFRYLGEAIDIRSLEIADLKGEPALDPIRDDPRFRELLTRVVPR